MAPGAFDPRALAVARQLRATGSKILGDEAALAWVYEGGAVV
jgi:hypothetical protein